MTLDAHAVTDSSNGPRPDKVTAALDAAKRLDSLVQVPFAYAFKALHSVALRRASSQSLYRGLEEQERAVRDSDGGMTLDELDRLMWLWQSKAALEEHFSPAPALEAWLARASHARPATDVTREAVFAWQRLTRGWDDRSLWSLDWYLCRTLGAQLTEMADIAHGWPSNDEFPTFEDWTHALRRHGAALTAAATYDILDDEQDEEALRLAAQESLRWVAEHLGDLWD